MPYLKDPVTLISNTIIKAFNSSQVPIKIYGGSDIGQGLSIGAGGATIVGSGESKEQIESRVIPDYEELYLVSDSIIKLITNLQNGWNSRKEILIDNGIFNALGYKWNGQSLDDRYTKKLFQNDIAPNSSEPPNAWSDGIYTKLVYQQDYPCKYGHVLTIRGGKVINTKSTTQILMSWKGADIWYRCADDLTNEWVTNWTNIQSSSSIKVADTDGYYNGTNVEDVLKELGAFKKTTFIDFPRMSNAPYYQQLCELSSPQKVGTSASFINFILSNIGDFGWSQLGTRLISVSTRGSISVRQNILMESAGEESIRLGYSSNDEIVKIWLKVPSWSAPLHAICLGITSYHPPNAHFTPTIWSASEPQGITYV